MKSISVRDLTKEFRMIGDSGQYRMLRDWASLRRSKRDTPRIRRFLALDGVSFEALPGEVIGVVGRNGAGKSTLLKILSRILRPTRGRVELRGRVGSLLEVGSGFHGELTGRENIFLNAAILGMEHREIVCKLDEIIDFAGIASHLDEPVKNYSSGMYMRLAFAVAAFIEPEILLVDEVLAVGDVEFQQKCIQRIEQVGQRGQTVLFVSHNMQAVLRLCNRALLIERGRLVQDGPVPEVAATYLRLGGGSQGERCYEDGEYIPGDAVAKLRRVRVRSRGGQTKPTMDISEEIGIEMEFEIDSDAAILFPFISIFNEWATEVLWATDSGTEWHGRPRPRGRHQAIAWIPANFFSAGTMSVTAALCSLRPRMDHFREADAVVFQAVDRFGPGTARGNFTDHIGAVTRPKLEWTVNCDCRSAKLV